MRSVNMERGLFHPWKKFTFRLFGGPPKVVRQMAQEGATFEVSEKGVHLYIGNGAGHYSIDPVTVGQIKDSGHFTLSFWPFALGRNDLPGLIEKYSIANASLDEFSRTLMEWARGGWDGPCPTYLTATVGQMGGIDLTTAPGALFWRKLFDDPNTIGNKVLLLGVREAGENLCYALNTETRQVLAYQIIDPQKGLLFSWIESSDRSRLTREYAARVGDDNRTYFGKCPILWPLRTDPGHIGRWITDEEGEIINDFSTRTSGHIPFREVSSEKGAERKTEAAIVGNYLGSDPSRFTGINGRMKITLEKVRNSLGIHLTRDWVELNQKVLLAAGLSEGDEIEISIDGPHIVEYHIPGQQIAVKLVHHLLEKSVTSTEPQWELSAASTKHIAAEHFHGITLIQGLKFSLYFQGPTHPFVGFKAGGKESYKLFKVPDTNVKYPRHASAMFFGDELIYFVEGYRFSEDDLRLLARVGATLQHAENGAKVSRDNLFRSAALNFEGSRLRQEGEGEGDRQLLLSSATKFLEAFVVNPQDRGCLLDALKACSLALEATMLKGKRVKQVIKKEAAKPRKTVNFSRLVAQQAVNAWRGNIEERTRVLIGSTLDLRAEIGSGRIDRERALSRLVKIAATLQHNLPEIELYFRCRVKGEQILLNLAKIKTQTIPALVRIIEGWDCGK